MDLNILKDLFQISTRLTSGEIIASLFLTLVISILIFWVYKRTYSGVIYSRDFNLTLIIVSLVVTVVMLGISRNLVLSLGLVGALSIVRFRNAIKDSKDVAFIFWAITAGIVNGVQMYKLSIISSIFIAVVLLVGSRRFPERNNNYVVVLKQKGASDKKMLHKIFLNYAKNYRLRSSTVSRSLYESVYEVNIKKNASSDLLKNLNDIKNMESVSIISHTGDLIE